jgi:hypothetical protein
MFITAKLVLANYIPTDFVKGMWFKQRIKDVIYGKVYEYDRVFELNHIPSNREEFTITNGYPVRPVIMSITANPDEKAVVLATAEQIGWWDDEPWNDGEDAELRDIELKDINLILSDYDGELDIQVHDHMFEKDIVEVVLYMDKVTLGLPTDKSLAPEDGDDYDEDTPPDDYEDMDWEDDEPEEDSAGFTISDRYNPEDYETE